MGLLKSLQPLPLSRFIGRREMGRIGQAGTVRETGFATETAAIAAGAAVRRRKEKRSYPAVNGFDTAG